MQKERKKKEKILIVVGTRKRAIARAIIHDGTGIVRINSVPLERIEPRYKNMRLREPLIIAGDASKKVDIDIKVSGGGVWGQADASRTAIANALIEWTKNDALKQAFIDYDRSLLISDPRRTEPHKPSRSNAGPRRSKQQSKR